MSTNLIDFQTHKLSRGGLSAALATYIVELQADGITLDTPLALGAVLADVAQLAAVELPPPIQTWLDKPSG